MKMEPHEFIGYILSIKTHKSATDGASKAIIGTLRVIDTKGQTITLDDVMINGTIVEDGYILNSTTIEDLSVCGKPDQSLGGRDDMVGCSVIPEPVPLFSSTPVEKKPLTTPNTVPRSNNIQIPRSTESLDMLQEQFQIFGIGGGKPKAPVTVTSAKKIQNQPNHQHFKSSAFVKTDKGKMERTPNPFYGLNPECGGPMGKGPPPTKPSSTAISKMENSPKPSPDSRLVYSASELEKNYFDQSSSTNAIINSVIEQLANKTKVPNSKSTPALLAASVEAKGKLLQDQNQDPTKLVNSSFNITADNPLFKLFQPQLVPKSELQSDKAKITHSPGRSGPTHSTNTNDRVTGSGKQQQQKRTQNESQTNPPAPTRIVQKHGVPASAFEMTNDEIRAQEFDFDKNLAMFEKLPVAAPMKTKVTAAVKNKNSRSEPKFNTTDTTYLAERHIASVKLLNDKPQKVFVTDTGVVVPAVPLATRSKILNMAHTYGLTHGRMVEIMGRATAQIAIPMLGDSYRLSPEREEDRPSVLVFAGPHWNGAVGVCAARVLATQGIRTNVFVWNFELPIFTTELQLYRLTKQTVTTDLNALKGINYDLVIAAMNDHRDTALNVKPFLRWMKDRSILIVDPPILPSYRKAFLDESSGDCLENGVSSNRLAIVTPTLPLAYQTEPFVKLHLVNMGIPLEMFETNEVIYKSPFGDKLILPLFATKQDISTIS